MCGNPTQEDIRKLTGGGAAGSGLSDSSREIPFSPRTGGLTEGLINRNRTSPRSTVSAAGLRDWRRQARFSVLIGEAKAYLIDYGNAA